MIASICGLGFNVIADPVASYFYKQYILGQPQEVAAILAKMGAITTLVNAIVSTILVAVVYNVLRPVLKRQHILNVM